MCLSKKYICYAIHHFQAKRRRRPLHATKVLPFVLVDECLFTKLHVVLPVGRVNENFLVNLFCTNRYHAKHRGNMPYVQSNV